ncbi:hypothetical protein HQ587_02660 [bacterium]|nr:hypothetical protein [bacterium]
MKTLIQGKQYNYNIITNCKEDVCCFSIRPTDPATGRYSNINNLNTILAEFDIDPWGEKFVDSVWVLDYSETAEFEKIAVNLLTDKTFMEYLERKLDEDRQCGEWENIEKVHH